MADALESVLLVFQDAVPGREFEYDQWYTNVHIRDVMRLDGSLAVQRFIRSPLQLAHGGKSVSHHVAHTIYELSSYRDCIRGHMDNAFTERMPISTAGTGAGVFDFYFEPVLLSRSWTLRDGFRDEGAVVTARVDVAAGQEARFERWFGDHHLPWLLAGDAAATVGLFRVLPEQMMAFGPGCNYAIVHGTRDLAALVARWDAHFTATADGDYALTDGAIARVGCYEPRIPRLRAASVRNPGELDWAIDRQARALASGDRVFTVEQWEASLTH